MSTSTRCKVRRPAAEKLGSLQQASGRLHVETWAGRDGSLSLPISQAVPIVPGGADMVSRLPPPFLASVSPGPFREVRSGIVWTSPEKLQGEGCGGFEVPWEGKMYSMHSLQLETGSRKDRSSQRGRSSRFIRVLVHTRMGRVRLSGHKSGSGAGYC